MKASKKEMILSVALCLLPILLGVYLWKDLPDMVPTHFDVNNNPNGYSSKTFAVFGLPALMAALDALCLFGLKSDPKAKKQSEAIGKLMLWFVPLLCCILEPVCLFAALGRQVNIALYSQILIGVLFIFIGNYLPKCRQNYTMGIKIPWTLEDEDNWNYTHRLAGFLWVIGGFVMLINAFVGFAWLTFVIIIVDTLVPTVASYLYYRRHKE